jgi:nitrogen fixation NifU-like protein
MDPQERMDLILDHYERPRFAGELAGADVVQTGTTAGCGDRVTVYLRLDGPGRAASLTFQGEGCTISQAAASMAMEMMQGWTLQQIDQATPESILDALGPDIAANRWRCATLAFNAVQAASLELQRRPVEGMDSR